MDVLEERLSLGGSVGVRTVAAPGLMTASAARRLLHEHAVDKLVGDVVTLLVSQRSDENGTRRRVLSFVPASRAPASQPSDVLETSTVFLAPHPLVDDKVLVECVTDVQAASRPPAPPFVCKAAVPRSTRPVSDRLASVTAPVVSGAQVQKTSSNTSKNSTSSSAPSPAAAAPAAAPPAAGTATSTAQPHAPAATGASPAGAGAQAPPASGARTAPHGSLMSMFARQQAPKQQTSEATPGAAPNATVKAEPAPVQAAALSPAAGAQSAGAKPSTVPASKRRVDSSDDEAEPAGKRHDAARSSKPAAAAAAPAPVEARRSASPEVRARVPRRVRRVSDSDDDDGDKKPPTGKSVTAGASQVAASAAKRPEIDHKKATSPTRGAPRVLEPRPAPASAPAPAATAAAASSSNTVARTEPKAQPAAQAAASSAASGAPATASAAESAVQPGAAANAEAHKVPTLIAPAARKRRTKKVMKEVFDSNGYMEMQLVEVTDDEAGNETPAAGAKPADPAGPGAAAAAAAAAENAPRASGAVKAAPTKQLGLASFFGRK